MESTQEAPKIAVQTTHDFTGPHGILGVFAILCGVLPVLCVWGAIDGLGITSELEHTLATFVLYAFAIVLILIGLVCYYFWGVPVTFMKRG